MNYSQYIRVSDNVVFPFKFANAIKTVTVQSLEVTFLLNCWERHFARTFAYCTV